MSASLSRVVPPIRGTSARSNDAIAELALRVRGSWTHAPCLEFVDVEAAAPVAAWRGAVARHLLDAPALGALVDGDGDYPCSQACLRQLVLAAAAVEASLEWLTARRDSALAGSTPCEDGARPGRARPRRGPWRRI